MQAVTRWRRGGYAVTTLTTIGASLSRSSSSTPSPPPTACTAEGNAEEEGGQSRSTSAISCATSSADGVTTSTRYLTRVSNPMSPPRRGATEVRAPAQCTALVVRWSRAGAAGRRESCPSQWRRPGPRCRRGRSGRRRPPARKAAVSGTQPRYSTRLGEGGTRLDRERPHQIRGQQPLPERRADRAGAPHGGVRGGRGGGGGQTRDELGLEAAQPQPARRAPLLELLHGQKAQLLRCQRRRQLRRRAGLGNPPSGGWRARSMERRQHRLRLRVRLGGREVGKMDGWVGVDLRRDTDVAGMPKVLAGGYRGGARSYLAVAHLHMQRVAFALPPCC